MVAAYHSLVGLAATVTSVATVMMAAEAGHDPDMVHNVRLGPATCAPGPGPAACTAGRTLPGPLAAYRWCLRSAAQRCGPKVRLPPPYTYTQTILPRAGHRLPGHADRRRDAHRLGRGVRQAARRAGLGAPGAARQERYQRGPAGGWVARRQLSTLAWLLLLVWPLSPSTAAAPTHLLRRSRHHPPAPPRPAPPRSHPRLRRRLPDRPRPHRRRGRAGRHQRAGGPAGCAPDRLHRRRRHAGGHHAAQQLLGLRAVRRGLHAQQRPAHNGARRALPHCGLEFRAWPRPRASRGAAHRRRLCCGCGRRELVRSAPSRRLARTARRPPPPASPPRWAR
jgi:hypothetical protein